jgi:hypothetical protein
MKSPRQGKPTAVSESIYARLNTYALAAGAAGVGVLAFTQTAQAKVIYTPTEQVVGGNGVLTLDVAGVGTVDFLIQEWDNGGFPSSNALLADAAVGNGVEGSKRKAAALSSGAVIGPQANFIAGDNNGEAMVSITHSTTGGTSHVHGDWVNVANRYLGLKFQIAGKTHYGWARLNVKREQFHIVATLTGYAYETTPNTPIVAGETADGAANSLPAPGPLDRTAAASAFAAGTAEVGRNASLSELALGAESLRVRRQP